MKLVPVDHDPFADAPAASSSGPKLVPVDHDPFADGQVGDASAAVGRGLINGVPVVGPYLLGGVNRVAAGIRSLKNDTRFSDELANVERFGENTAAEHPIASVAGEIGGGVVGSAPLVAAAPAAFGVGAGGLGVRTLAATASGAALGGADSAVRSGGKLDDIEFGAWTGGALGGAGPVVGRGIGKLVTAVRGEAPGMPLLREATEGLSEAELASAQFIRDQALSSPGGPVALSVGEALNAATGGRAGRVSQLERVAANSGGEGGRIASELYAARPAAIDNAARAAFDGVTPTLSTPTGLGFDVQAAARSGIAQTPEGMALTQAREAVGPRTSADRAGQVIQREMTTVRDAREATRAEQAARDYGAARDAPDRIGIERTVTVERPGEPMLQTLNNNAGAPLRYDPPPQGPDTLGSLAPTRPEAPPVPPGAKSLARYIAENGGIGLERGDVKAAGLDRFHQPGVANLVRENGKGIDAYWRTKLIEEGYLPPDRGGGMERNIHDELIGLLEQEQRGRRTYPWDWQGSDDRSGFSQMRDEFQAASSTALADVRKALAEAGVDPRTVDKGVLDRTAAALVRGEHSDPLTAFERVVMAAKEPMSGPSSRMVPTTVTEEISAPRFGQVNPQAAVDALDRQALTAKGDVRSSLDQVRRDLFEVGTDPVSGVRETDLSVEGLLHARERLDQRIGLARRDGDATKVRDLQTVRASLDEQLKGAPEVATADANFARNSRPLDVFGGDTPLGRVTQQDPLTGRMATPSEEVPSHLRGATAARELLANATPEARTAYGNRLATQILDGATDKRGAIDPDRLNGLLRDNADVLEMLPEVYGRLDGVVRARDGLDRVLASPLGRIAEQPNVKRAIGAVFSPNPLPGSADEVADAMAALARNRPTAARELARVHLEGVFNEATQQQRGLAAQYGGAGFASAVRGNPQQRRNLEAVLRALPDGETIWKGVDRLMTTLEATGYRPQKGSDTAFNQAIQKRLDSGNTRIGHAISDVTTGAAAGASVGGATGGAAGALVGLRRTASDAMTRASMLGQSEALSRLMFDPRALPDLRALAKSPVGSPNAELFTRRLMTLANGGAAPLRQPGAK
ncbi:hypothetical protein [Methylorubrum suomiense]|uniref:Uncharacterized protein n=1 Tax=Methylorubrum suomiense TaxID=144191 RepID=A0ABQ4UTZ5_9HYPH|nr:hypothetical protein [Methylorubrum suomiense]GJE74492.1 hypothetical protein BGCPKDLD_1063 [Methylorubrum suomiense]